MTEVRPACNHMPPPPLDFPIPDKEEEEEKEDDNDSFPSIAQSGGQQPQCKPGGNVLPKKPPRRASSPPRMTGPREVEYAIGILRKDGRGNPEAIHPLGVESSQSDPAAVNDAGKPRRPLLPPGYVSRHHASEPSMSVMPSASVPSLASDQESSGPHAIPLPDKGKALKSASSGLYDGGTPSCPAGKPARPVKPPMKYKPRVALLQKSLSIATGIGTTTTTAEATSTVSSLVSTPESDTDVRGSKSVVALVPSKPPRRPLSSAWMPPTDTSDVPPPRPASPLDYIPQGIQADVGACRSSAGHAGVPDGQAETAPVPSSHSCPVMEYERSTPSSGQTRASWLHNGVPASTAGRGSHSTTHSSTSVESGIVDDVVVINRCEPSLYTSSKGSSDLDCPSLACDDSPSAPSRVFEDLPDNTVNPLKSKKAGSNFDRRMQSLRETKQNGDGNTSTTSQDNNPLSSSKGSGAPVKDRILNLGSIPARLPDVPLSASGVAPSMSHVLASSSPGTPVGTPPSLRHAAARKDDQEKPSGDRKSSTLTHSVSDDDLGRSGEHRTKTLLSMSSTLPRRMSEDKHGDWRATPILKNLKKNVKKLTSIGPGTGGHSDNSSKQSSKASRSDSSNSQSKAGLSEFYYEAPYESPKLPSRSGHRPVEAPRSAAHSTDGSDTTDTIMEMDRHNIMRPRLKPVVVRAGQEVVSMEEEDSDSEEALGGDSLFQYVLVIKLTKDENGKYSPRVTYQFPPKLSEHDESSKDEGLQSIPAFCFPDLQLWTEPVNTYKSETFSFILTDIGGRKRFGYCRRLLPARGRPCMPEVYCLISPLGCFSLYSKILDHVEQRIARSSSAVFAFLKAVIAKPFPSPGRKVVVSAFGGGVGMDTVVLKRPKDSAWLEHVDFEVLTSKLSYEMIMKIFAALVNERHILFVAERLSTLSTCILACVALLYPFEWQHVFIPVLPASLIDICCSPLPYIIGVMKSAIEPVINGDLPVEENVLIVDLDEGRFITDVLNDLSVMPNKHRSDLETSLKSACRSTGNAAGQSSRGQAIVAACMNFFIQTIGHYRKCYKAADGIDFDMPLFIKSGSKSSSEFLTAFSKTQMFDMFIQENSTASTNAGGMFELAMAENYGSSDDVLGGHTAFKLHKQAKAKIKGFIWKG